MRALPARALLAVLLFTGSVTGNARSASAAGLRFSSILERAPEKIWSSSLDSRVASSVHSFLQKSKLPDGKTYGASVRHLDLSRLCQGQIERLARSRGCTARKDVLLDPRDNRPLRDARGREIPLLTYLCPDGGVIRMKPEGDPTNPREHAPSVVKAMRFFGSQDYRNFSDEAFKVDNDGRPIPKSPRDLNTRLAGISAQADRHRFIEEWARDAHTPLRRCP